ncbi:CBS domain-containing protein [Streptomyces sp. G45]|uniref:CBS domain-containing protein n=1 Tax=Streptomyces sp. G45 TaxID=3406627 RepID=UPI003C29407E
MSSPAVTVHPQQRVADAARVMERHRVERLPVVDEEDRLIGIATRRDLLRVFLRADEDILRDVHGVVTRTTGRPDHGVGVSVVEGVVTLEGRLEHPGDAAHLLRRSWRIDGVVGVVCRLRPAGPAAPGGGPSPGEGHPAPADPGPSAPAS